MKKLVYLACASLFFSIGVSAQEPTFLNTNQSLIFLNPSFAGSNGGARNQLSYRNQWPLLSGRYVTYANSFDMYIKPLKVGIALTYLIDDAAYGTLKSSALSFAYAQHLNLGDHLKIIPSVQFSYRQKYLDTRNLTFGASINPRMGTIWSNPSIQPQNHKVSVSASAGLLINVRKNLYVGAYVFHMNQPDEGLLGASKLPARFLFHASYNLKVSDQTRLQFFWRSEVQNKFWMQQMAVNAVFFEHFITGLGYTTFDTPLINVGYRHNFFTIQLGYDMVFSRLAGNTAGSWEVHTSFNLRSKEQRREFTNFENW